MAACARATGSAQVGPPNSRFARRGEAFDGLGGQVVEMEGLKCAETVNWGTGFDVAGPSRRVVSGPA